MRIRYKLLVLLLAIALLPIGVIGLLNYRALSEATASLRTAAQSVWETQAQKELRQLAQDFGRTIRREVQTLEVVVAAQAEAIRNALHQPPDGAGPAVRWLGTATGRPRAGTDERAPLWLYAHDEPNKAYEERARRMAQLPRALEMLSAGHLGLIERQSMVFTDGLHAWWPTPPADAFGRDLRTSAWYQRAVLSGESTWTVPRHGPEGDGRLVTLAQPVEDNQGRLLGVTALRIQAQPLLTAIRIPTAWSKHATSMIVVPHGQERKDAPLLVAVARLQYGEADRVSRKDVPDGFDFVDELSPAALGTLYRDLLNGQSNAIRTRVRDRDSLVAYAPAGADGTTLVLIVPLEHLMTQATRAVRTIETLADVQVAMLWFSIALATLLATLAALLSSRTFVRPLTELAAAANRLATGDLTAQARVRAGDELGDLSEAFNRMAPQLADRLELRQSLELAMEVQQRLLPAAAPYIAGLDIAGRSDYCDETGGDYFDYLDLSEQRPGNIAIVIGDVTGHGVSAALLMATARAMLRSAEHQPDGLADMMANLNARLTADTDGARFMTLAYLLIDQSARQLHWVLAGHDPPMIYAPESDEFSELRDGGLPLGILADSRYQEHVRSAPAGECIILLGTDGVWETRNLDGELFGKRPVQELVRRMAHEPADVISEKIMAELAAFRGLRQQEDDVTIVVVKLAAARTSAGKASASAEAQA